MFSADVFSVSVHKQVLLSIGTKTKPDPFATSIGRTVVAIDVEEHPPIWATMFAVFVEGTLMIIPLR
ncbi:MAG: hypothetical protein EKK55_17420 [Rhodocyclaceae bacterium]|nr:MAG: hypothetical protein EKK55_17420 [Rhodocyclaceae bacterium]